MPPSGLVHQIKLAKGLAENGAGLCLLSGLILIVVSLVALYFITIYQRNGSQMPWYYLIIIGCVELFALLIVTRFVASGAAYGVLSKRDQACEMWQRRLDQFILTGSWDADGYGVGPVSEKGSAPDVEQPFESYYVKTNKSDESLLTPLAIVTGANSGVGYETAETLLQCGFKVVLACRNTKAAEEARTKMLMACRERVWARYREAFQCDKSPLRDNDNCHGLEETRPFVPLDDGSIQNVKEVHWAGVKRRARALMAALPLNVAVVPLDLGSIPSIDGFVKVMVQEHFHGVRGEDLISGPSQLWAHNGGGDRDKTSGEARSASEMLNSGTAAKSGTKTVSDNCEQPVPPLKCFHDGIRVLVNNAGCYYPTYGGLPPFAGNVEGLVGVNYVGPTLLTNALLKGIKGAGIDSLPGILSSSRSSSPSKTSPGETEGSAEQTDREDCRAATDISRRLPLRIINVSSVAHTWALEGNKEVGIMECEIGAKTNPKTDEFLVSRILKVLEAISTPEATPFNNTVLKRHIKNTYGLSKLGAIALTRAVCELDSQCRLSNNLAVEDKTKTSPQMCLPKIGVGLNITTYSLHPGAVRTAVFRSAPKAVQLVIETAGLLLFKTPQEGAALQVYLSLYADHEQLARDSLTSSVIKHDASHQTSQKVNRPLFASSIPPRNPSPIPPNGQYFTDSGAVDDQKSHLASAEALSHAAMLAMNRWALVMCKEHIKEWPTDEDKQQSPQR